MTSIDLRTLKLIRDLESERLSRPPALHRADWQRQQDLIWTRRFGALLGRLRAAPAVLGGRLLALASCAAAASEIWLALRIEKRDEPPRG